VVVVGSYLNSQEWLGDVDLAIRLDRRPEFAEQWPEALLARTDAAASRGRRFRGFLDRLAWPEIEVRRYLRGGVQWLSLHDWTKEEPWLHHAAHKVLLEEETPGVAGESAAQKNSDSRMRPQKVGSGARRPSKRTRGCPF
jgi:hypothetical protein